MYSFDGKHRQKPVVSLGGASRKEEKSAFMEKKLFERQKRHTAKSEWVASIQIQKFIRGCLCRKREGKRFRNIFDQEISSVTRNTENPITQKVISMIRLIFFFYNPSKDHERLIILCQIILKLHTSNQAKGFGNVENWLFHLKSLLYLCIRALEHCKDPSTPVAVPLRMLEIFTDEKSCTVIWKDEARRFVKSIMFSLVEKGYFKCLRTLINNKVPSSLEMSIRPPTPLAATVKDLTLRPITVASSSSASSHADESTSHEVLRTFANEFLCREMTDQIFLFLIPSLSAEIPLSDLLDALLQVPDASLKGPGPLQTRLPEIRVEPSPWLLYALLTFGKEQLANIDRKDLVKYLMLLRILVPRLSQPKASSTNGNVADDSDSDEEMETDIPDDTQLSDSTVILRNKCLQLLDSSDHVQKLISFVEFNKQRPKTHDDQIIQNNVIEALCHIAYALLRKQRLLLHETSLLQCLAFSHGFIKSCWMVLSNIKTKTAVGKEVLFLYQLSRGSVITEHEKEAIIPLLSVFCTLFRHALFCIYDTDFYSSDAGTSKSMMPFTLKELENMSTSLLDVLIGLVQMMFSDTRANVVAAYGKAMLSVGAGPLGQSGSTDGWSSLFQDVTQLVKQLHSRDNRHKFCSEGHWLSPRIAINADQVTIEGYFEDPENGEGPPKPGMSALTARSLAILRNIPFSVPFLQRVKIFQRILTQDKQETQDSLSSQFTLPEQGQMISVNRKYLYQDAYDQLSQERAPNIKKKVRVKMINTQGLDEAGIDGGGIFREFMNQFLKTGFDPSYGFFKATSEQFLYPNPQAEKIVPECQKHFHFLGRMLGKAIYENMMVEMPFAPFFLCKLLNRHSADVDIHHLESLDPEVYRNLFSLKNYEGDFDDIALNFTVTNGEFGSIEVVDLKPGGADIPVTSSNKIEYIHLMANYRLNKQIRSQCNAFRAGLSDVINIEWLQMFDHRELQVLISGAPVPVDLDDLRANTNYSGNYSDDHQYIEALWDILHEFNDTKRRQFLKFVTSCSRPPLLGFKELYPKMCIHYGGAEDRLPSASTCMNILKLPEYASREILKARLLYAVESDAGFELS